MHGSKPEDIALMWLKSHTLAHTLVHTWDVLINKRVNPETHTHSSIFISAHMCDYVPAVCGVRPSSVTNACKTVSSDDIGLHNSFLCAPKHAQACGGRTQLAKLLGLCVCVCALWSLKVVSSRPPPRPRFDNNITWGLCVCQRDCVCVCGRQRRRCQRLAF